MNDAAMNSAAMNDAAMNSSASGTAAANTVAMSPGRAIGLIYPFTNGVSGTVALPGSKSITNRAVLCAALASGTSTLDGVLFADDTEAMIEAVTALGATVKINRDQRRLVIDGIGGNGGAGSDGGTDSGSGPRSQALTGDGEPTIVHARSSGTTARFLLPVVAALGGRWLLDGDPQLRARPLDDQLAALRELSELGELRVAVHELGEPGCLPVEIRSDGPVSGGPVSGGPVSGDPVSDGVGESALLRRVRIRADTSSQFVSGMLLAAPLLGGIQLEVDASFDTVSQPYIDMTVAVMEAFGAKVDVQDDHNFAVGPEPFRSTSYRVEPDASAASYVWAAAAICGGTACVDGLNYNSIQGDVRFAEVLGQMGAEVTVSDDAISVGSPLNGALRGGSFDLRDFSDTAQTLAVVAAFAEGTTDIGGIGFIRRKETDRIVNTANELVKRGVDAIARPDGITIRPNPFGLRAGVVDCHGDHRMAMAMSLMGLRICGIEIGDPDCVAKTFPEFFGVLESLRASPGTDPKRLLASNGLDSNSPKVDITVSNNSASNLLASPVVAIDGPAASGKSSVARAVAAMLNMEYLDTGAMYRAVAWAAIRAGVDPHDLDAVATIARTAVVQISSVRGVQHVTVNGTDVSAEIRTAEVDRCVSAVAANPAVRRVLVERQRSWAVALGGGVMEGRDIGSVVFPDAVLKVFLTATPSVRAERRLAQQAVAANSADQPSPNQPNTNQPSPNQPNTNLPNTNQPSANQRALDAAAITALAEELYERDRLDSARSDSPLRLAPGAVIVDTSELTQDQAVAQIALLYSLAAGASSTGVNSNNTTNDQ